MIDSFQNSSLEPTIRLSIFLGVLLLMMLIEWFIPKRSEQKRKQRWAGNLGIVVIDTLLVRLLLPGFTVGLAIWANHLHIGLFQWLPLPSGLSLFLSVLLLDMAIYWQHRWSHQFPMLWNIHKMHHTDTAIDVTTGLRFHPIEIILSILYKLVIITVLGASAWAVIIFEILLNATAMFNHSNFVLPKSTDKLIRKFFVTPDMHRVHHSIYAEEYNQNYGFNLSIWDYIFKSYTDQPKDGHLKMRIGLPFYRQEQEAKLRNIISQPFRSPED